MMVFRSNNITYNKVFTKSLFNCIVLHFELKFGMLKDQGVPLKERVQVWLHFKTKHFVHAIFRIQTFLSILCLQNTCFKVRTNVILKV